MPKVFKKKPVLAVSVDLQKAYDSVDPGFLTEKLAAYGLDDHWIRTIHNLLSNRLFSVIIDGNVSRTFRAIIGLPQGSSLAPLLFKLFIHDLPQPTVRFMRSFVFADDLLTVAWGSPLRIKSSMQRYLRTVHKFYSRNGLTVNINKSQSLVITGTLNRLSKRTRIKCKPLNVTMGGVIVPRADSLRYLGVDFNDKFSFVQNVSRSVAKICCTMGNMKRVLVSQRLLTSARKIAFYKAAIRPVLVYGFPVWSAISSHQMQRIRVAERRFLRWTRKDRGRNGYKFIDSSKLYQEANVQRIDAWMVSLYIKTFDKFRTSDNEWVNPLFHNDNITRAARNEKYPGPEQLYHQNTIQPLFNAEGKILHFNRRIRDGAELYVTAQ